MTPAEFEQALEVRGVTVYSHAGELRYLAPPGAMTTELRAAAVIHRDVLVRMSQAADAALDKALEDEYQGAVARSRRQALVGAA